MKNHEIIRALPQLKQLRQDAKSLDAEIFMTERQLKGLHMQREQLKREIQLLSEVTRVIDNVAVVETKYDTIYGYDYRIAMAAVNESTRRSAEVYTNAHTSENGKPKDWAIKLHTHVQDAGPQRNEKWLNSGWAFRDAVDVAKAWVVRGNVPSAPHQEMCRRRHQLDPDGRAPRRRRLAFEAAWMAGQIELAVKLLTERVKRAKERQADAAP